MIETDFSETHFLCLHQFPPKLLKEMTQEVPTEHAPVFGNVIARNKVVVTIKYC